MLIDKWIQHKIGLDDRDSLSREKLEEYQLLMLQKTIKFAKENSRFYGEHLKDISPDDIKNLDHMETLPFMTPEMLKSHGGDMVCVPQSQISRIVTLGTSGSTGEPKRIFFTEEDQELTIDYFHYGMRVMTNPEDIFLILIPCKTPGSVGDLLKRGLTRDGVQVIAYSYPAPDESQDDEIIQIIKNKGVTSIIGTPPVTARLARKSAGQGIKVKTALITAEFVSQANVDAVETNWDCEVFEHYGMTEAGLGGAMACTSHQGYHPREADLLFEIIDPDDGKVLPDGEWGELVFTTLTRKGMPFIRYRTGDMTRWITESCPCGSLLKRLDRVGERDVPKCY